jgi:bifunctional non-homologous end joining protein LigD
MEIASRCGPLVRGEKAVPSRGGANQTLLRKKSCQKKGLLLIACPPFIALQLCTSVERPPAGTDWVHEIKFDGYRIQMRVEDGNVSLKTRKGLEWSPRFGAIATAAATLPDCLVDGEIVALDHRGSPDFAGLQAAL